MALACVFGSLDMHSSYQRLRLFCKVIARKSLPWRQRLQMVNFSAFYLWLLRLVRQGTAHLELLMLFRSFIFFIFAT